MVRIGRQKGFTLVEIMIALVILVGLMFTANYSYSLYTRYWSGRLGAFDQTIFHYQGLMQVKETIDSAIPYVVRDSQGAFTFYFLGRDEGFTLVSAAPIFAPTVNDASVVRIFAEKAAGEYRLVYEEAPLQNELLVDLQQQLNFKYRTVLLRSAEPIHFSYYGWEKREFKFSHNEHFLSTPQWSNSYDAALTRIQPERVRMSIGDQQLQFSLPVGQSKLINFYMDERQG